jgi:transcriptional regulator with XRE-family HTH domain
MTKRTLGSLGAMVRTKRGDRKLREVAKEMDIGPATLLRVESGRIPDVATFGKICRWLEIDPGSFLGWETGTELKKSKKTVEPKTILVSAHLRADRTPKPETVNALAKMILFAARGQQGTEEIADDGDA